MNKSNAQKRNARPLLDTVIRNALVHRHLRRQLSRANTIVVHELGLAHAKTRIDVAMVNGTLHGFEIKGDQDNLDRLPRQLEIYCQTLQRLTLVVASCHLNRVTDLAPYWCGLLEATIGPRGAVVFRSARASKRNPDVDTFLMAHLLWSDEVRAILAQRGVSKRELRAPRKELYRELVRHISERELTTLIKSAMMQRQAWRDHLRLE